MDSVGAKEFHSTHRHCSIHCTTTIGGNGVRLTGPCDKISRKETAFANRTLDRVKRICKMDTTMAFMMDKRKRKKNREIKVRVA
jgi:hypothetical protein